MAFSFRLHRSKGCALRNSRNTNTGALSAAMDTFRHINSPAWLLQRPLRAKFCTFCGSTENPRSTAPFPNRHNANTCQPVRLAGSAPGGPWGARSAAAPNAAKAARSPRHCLRSQRRSLPAELGGKNPWAVDVFGWGRSEVSVVDLVFSKNGPSALGPRTCGTPVLVGHPLLRSSVPRMGTFLLSGFFFFLVGGGGPYQCYLKARPLPVVCEAAAGCACQS